MSAELSRFIRGKYPKAQVAAVRLEGDTILISTARPGLLIGKEGAAFEKLCAELEAFRGTKGEVKLEEIRRPELEPVLVADDVAMKLSRGRPPEKLLEVIAEQCLRVGAKGCAIEVLGAIVARCERGSLDGAAQQATTEAVMEPKFTVDDDGNELPPPPQPDPPPKFSVSVRISR